MTITVRTDHRIMKRSTRHLIMANGDNLLYAAITFAEVIDYCRAHDIERIIIEAGSHRVALAIGQDAIAVQDPRQATLPWQEPAQGVAAHNAQNQPSGQKTAHQPDPQAAAKPAR